MLKSRKERLVFSMALGMEIYNTAIQAGVQAAPGGLSGLTYPLLAHALAETAYMGLIVLLFSSLWGNRAGGAFAARHCNPERDNAYFCRLLRQGGTVAVMCPTMSLAASILFSVILAGAPVAQLPVIWIGTTLKTFPMALRRALPPRLSAVRLSSFSPFFLPQGPKAVRRAQEPKVCL